MDIVEHENLNEIISTRKLLNRYLVLLARKVVLLLKSGFLRKQRLKVAEKVEDPSLVEQKDGRQTLRNVVQSVDNASFARITMSVTIQGIILIKC